MLVLFARWLSFRRCPIIRWRQSMRTKWQGPSPSIYIKIIDCNHPIVSKEAHNILPQPKCRDISYKWWNVVLLKVHQALYKISKEYQTVLGRHSLHSAYWPQRQVCSIPVYWQFLQIFLSRGRYQIFFIKILSKCYQNTFYHHD